MGNIFEKEALLVFRAAEKMCLSPWEGSHLLQILRTFLSDVFICLFLFHFVLLSVSHPKTHIRSCIAQELDHSRSFVSSVKKANRITEVFGGETC